MPSVTVHLAEAAVPTIVGAGFEGCCLSAGGLQAASAKTKKTEDLTMFGMADILTNSGSENTRFHDGNAGWRTYE